MNDTVNPVDYVILDLSLKVRVPIVECERCKKREPMVPTNVRSDRAGKPEWVTEYSADPPGWTYVGDWYFCAGCVRAAKAFMEKP